MVIDTSALIAILSDEPEEASHSGATLGQGGSDGASPGGGGEASGSYEGSGAGGTIGSGGSVSCRRK